MDSTIKAEWVKRLRDGRPQVKNRLQTPQGQCCLGVLCEIAAEQDVVGFEEGGGITRYDGRTAILPQTVAEWAGMGHYMSNSLIQDELTDLNDEKGYSFNQIADYIQENL